jgi:Tol biopolymer transport system component
VRIFDMARDVSVRVSLEQADRVYAISPILSRDGRSLWMAGRPGIYRADAQGQEAEMLDPSFGLVSDVSPDGGWLLFSQDNRATGVDLWRLPLTSPPGKPEPYLQTDEHTANGRFSPDGRWVAYVQSDRTSTEVFVDAFPAKGQRTRVSPSGGSSPMWSADGRKLYYLSPDFRIMESAATPTPGGIEFAPAIELFQAPESNTYFNRTRFWPAPDGQRFLYVARLDAAMPRTLNVILNWPALVKPTS